MNEPREDDELDRALAGLFHAADARTRAPEGFDARLFARLEREAPRAAAHPASAAALAWSSPALPWWVRIAGERHVALALLGLGALSAWPAWWLAGGLIAGARGSSIAGGAGRAVSSLMGPLLPTLFAPLAAPRVLMITAACLAPAIAWGSYQAALAAERWVRHAARTGPVGHAAPARHA